jgi:hypothetical protein
MSEPPPSLPLPAAQRNPRADRDVKPQAAPDKHGRKAAPAPVVAGRRLQPLAADEFDIEDVHPRVAVTPVADGAGPRTKAPGPELTGKPATPAGTVEVKPVQEVAKAPPSEPEIPVGAVELPNRGRVVVTPEPAKSAGGSAVASGSWDHAEVRFGSITTQAAVSKASIRSALNESAIRRCYTDALRLGAAGNAPMSAQLELATNMGGRIATAKVTGSLPKQLASCVEQVAKSGRVREVDTGIAKATVTLEFQP